MTKLITSADNAFFKSLVDCLSSKGIKKHGRFMVFGERAIGDTLKSHAKLVRGFLLCQGKHDPRRYSADAWELSKELFDEIDIFGTHHPILLMTAPDIPAINLAQQPPHGLEILSALGDPSNLGALLRSAAAFGAARVVLLKESASPLHPKAVRAASAMTLATPLAHGPSIRELTGPSIVALDMQGAAIESFKWPRDTRLLIGEEGPGIPPSGDFQRVAISMQPGVESLNAPIASSIAMYAYRLSQKS